MAKTDNIDRQELQDDLGTSWGVGLIMSVPELMVLAYRSQGWTNAKWDRKKKKIVIGKKTEGVEWDQTKIGLEIQNSRWYRNRDGSTRVAENARLSDPPTWARNVDDIAASLTRKAAEKGARLDGVDVKALAERILKENYLYVDRNPDAGIPESILDGFLVPYIKPGDDGQFGGDAGINAAKIRQTARAYGVQMTDQWYLDQVQKLESGLITEQDIKNQLVSAGKSAWAPMAELINENTSTMDIASAYIRTFASIMDQDEDTVSLDTPEIKKALTFVDPATGKPRMKSLWEFEQDLRMSPAWDGTKQGQKELSDAGLQMLRDFGFWK